MILNEQTDFISIRATGATLIFALGVLIGVPGATDEKDDAKQLFEEGKSLFVEKRYEAAIERFRSSLDRFPTYNGYYNLANSYRALRRYAEALLTVDEMQRTLGPSGKKEMREKFEEFESSVKAVIGTLLLKVTPDGASVEVDGMGVGTSPLLEPLILGPGLHEILVSKVGFEKHESLVQIESEKESALSVALAQAKGKLFLTIDEAGALVTVNDEPAGKTPLTNAIALPPGNHRVQVTKPGFRAIDQMVNIKTGAKTALSMSLDRLPKPPIDGDEKTAQKRRLSPLFFALLGGTVVAGGLSGAFWGMAAHKAGVVQDSNLEYVNAPTIEAAQPYDDRRLNAKDAGETYQKVAIGFTIASGLCAIATLSVMFRDLKTTQTKKAPAETTVEMSPSGVIVRF